MKICKNLKCDNTKFIQKDFFPWSDLIPLVCEKCGVVKDYVKREIKK